jgi:pimeloyl-ACP methyl ester carboxylesterase
MPDDKIRPGAGTNLTLFLLPGMLCDRALWRHQMAALAERAAIVVPELTGAASIAALAEEVLRSAPAKFALCGLSLGGYVALEIASQAPERVQRLALIASSARPDTPARRLERERALRQVRHGRFLGISPRLVSQFVHAENLRDPALLRTVTEMAKRVGRDAFIRQQTAALSRHDYRERLASIGCPTAVLCGREDRVTPLELSQELAAGIAGAELVVIEKCGHLPPLERPQEVSAALQRWLERPDKSKMPKD